MGKNINIDTGEWCDVVFEGKNKKYGAYRLRQSSSKRHIVAFLVIVVFVGVVAILPGLVSAVKHLTQREDLGPMEDTFALSNIPVEAVPEENTIKKETAPPPPPLKSTVKFTPPVITKDEDVKEKDQMKTNEEVVDSRLQVSMADVTGTDEKFGMDIAELKDRQVVTEEKPQEKPFITVEQMPTFPGGEAEMNKYVASNLKYPVSAQENGVQGRVTIRFVVTATGEISDVQVLRGIDPACDREAVRVVKSMPKWVAGKQNGRHVAVYFTLPVVFRLQQ